MTALEMFNNLDYGVFSFKFPNSVQCFKDYEKAFAFFPDENKIDILFDSITPEELRAINKMCEELEMFPTSTDNPKEENEDDLKPVESAPDTNNKPFSTEEPDAKEPVKNDPKTLDEYLTKIVDMYNYVCDNYSKEELIKSLINHKLDK